MSEITKEDCVRYEDVRISGRTNMWDVNLVCILSGLEKDKVMEIMKRYGELNVKWGFRK